MAIFPPCTGSYKCPRPRINTYLQILPSATGKLILVFSCVYQDGRINELSWFSVDQSVMRLPREGYNMRGEQGDGKVNSANPQSLRPGF